jgi:RNA polymerase sigma-70 factor (ECF subfamily)
MTETLVDTDFLARAEPYRRELLAHCYRMMGSVHDAEDLVQETYLRAWRGYAGFEGRSSIRTWLYGIATNTCLTALKGRDRRPMPTGLGGSSDPKDELVSGTEVPWLEPVPDALLGTESSDPAAIVTSRESIRLALIAALQHLPPRQRVVLILRDVLAWRAAEVAELLDLSTAAVNSVLQRARAQLDKIAPERDRVAEPDNAAARELLARYVSAFEDKNVPALVELFEQDIVWEMPPFSSWYLGAAQVGRHLDTRCPGGPGEFRLRAVAANGQPGFALYLLDRESGVFRAFGLQVLTIAGDRITHVANFMDPAVFDIFGLSDEFEPQPSS